MSQPEHGQRATLRAGSRRMVGLQLATLSAFAVAQPLLDILARHGEFFVAHRARPSDFVLLALLLSVGVPLVVLGIAWLLGAVAGGLGPASAAPVAGVLVALTALPAINRVESLPLVVVIVLALGLALGAGWLYWRRAAVRGFLTALAPAVLIFPLWFLLATPISSLLRPAAGAGGSEIPPIEATTPVVMVVFDELPVASLLAADGRIERRLYPNFAALADVSHWFRNATTVASSTSYSVPTMLWGRMPSGPRLPTTSDYPDNLFGLLGAGGYRQRVFEWHTSLCAPPLCDEGLAAAPLETRMLAMLGDIAIVYGHVVLPRGLATSLPAVDASWGGFGQPGDASSASPPGGASRSRDPVAFFGRFLEAIETGERSTFYFVHVNLPHVPWKYLPSGREYGPINMPIVPHGGEGGTWQDDPFQVAQGYQRHLLQVGLVDTLVGRLTAALETSGLWDEALLVVVADHGAGFAPGGQRRSPSSGNLGDIVNIPLLIKLPGQDAGTVSDRNVETIDLVPTIAEALGIEVPWQVDGVSAFDPAAERSMKVLRSLKDGADETLTFATNSLEHDRARTLERRASLLGESSDWDGVLRLGPGAGRLQGLAATEVVGDRTGQEADLEFALDQAEQWDAVEPTSLFVPSHVTGRLLGSSAEEKLPLGVVINGVVRATTWSYRARTGGVRFSALVPEDTFASGRNRVELLRLDLSGPSPTAIAIRQAGRTSYRRVGGVGDGMLEASDGRQFALGPRDSRAKARILPSQLGALVRGHLRPSGDALPDTLVVTRRGEPLFSAPFDEVRRIPKPGYRGKLVHFEFRLPEYVTREAETLGLFLIIGDRGEPVTLR